MQGSNWGDARPGKTRKGRWSQAERELLKEQYGLRDEKAIARDLSRSQASVRRMAEELFRNSARTGPWTAKEVDQLKRYLGATSTDVIARILGRDAGEVQSQIMELGRIHMKGGWTREETLRFKRIFGTRSDEDLALIFGRGLESVREHAKRHRLAKDKAFLRRTNGRGATRMPRWGENELGLLRQLYPQKSNLEIAKELDRTVKSIVSKAHHIGLKKELERLRVMGRENVKQRYQMSGSALELD